MKSRNSEHHIKIVGIDLAKSSFQIHAITKNGHKITNKKMTRNKLKSYMINLPACLVAMEACGSAHYWARLFHSYGHKVKLIAPQFVKPFVKSNKNDAVDAEAICEAVQRPNMRFVAIKEVSQQDIQSLHRMRSLAVSRRTAQVNQVRGLLLEYGIDIPKGRNHVREQLSGILENAENGLTNLFRALLSDLYEELVHLDKRIEKYEIKIKHISQVDEQARRLLTIPGIGPVVSTALIAAIGDINMFKNGRELAAWLGLVPRQSSTGGKPRLLGISKRGDSYLRALLIHGARSILQHAERKTDKTNCWINKLAQRRNKNIAAVAMANKIARTAFALLKHKQDYQLITESIAA